MVLSTIMTKKVFIIHCWGGNPKQDWYPWLKAELEKNGFKVKIPEMPNTDIPKINSWVNFLKKQVGKLDEDTYFIGHSIGCQTILRYLETLDEDIKIGGVILVAGWLNLNIDSLEEGAPEIAEPWLNTPIDFNKVIGHTDRFVYVYSNNDPYVPISDSELFKEKLGAKVIMEKNRFHFGGGYDSKTKELPVVVKELLRISK